MTHFPPAPPFTGKLPDDIVEAPSHDDDHHHLLLPDSHHHHDDDDDLVDHSPPPYLRSTSSLGLGPSWPVPSSGPTRTLTHDEITEWRRLRRDTGHLGRLALLRAGAVVEPFRPTPLVRHGNSLRDGGRGLAAAAAAAAAEEKLGEQRRLSAAEETRGWMGCLWDWAVRVGNRVTRTVRFVFARRKRVARPGPARDVQDEPKYDLFRDPRDF
ncbi:hypothetical protein MY4824_003685 [Beauveria thailandica]